MPPYILRKNKSSIHDLVDGGAVDGYPGDYPGKIYFVNNITGASANDGLSWANAFDQVSTAITASEADRLARSANDRYIRNRIYVQGTATAYTALTALPNHCDIIGIGANPRGNGTGIAIISGAGAADACDEATGVRGLYLENLQFGGGGAYYAFDCAVMFRSEIFNCAFMNCTSGSRIVTGGGNHIHKCMFGGDTSMPSTALAVGTAAGNWNNCLIEDNFFYGSTYGYVCGAYLSDNTVFRGNMVYGATEGVRDTGTNATMAANAFYVDNFVSGADAMTFVVNTDGARTLGNAVANGTTGAREDAAT